MPCWWKIAGVACVWGVLSHSVSRPAFCQPKQILPEERSISFEHPIRIDPIRRLWSIAVEPQNQHPANADISGISIVHQIVILPDARGIRALSITSGKSAWPATSLLSDDGFLVRAELSLCNDRIAGAIIQKDWIGWINGGLLSLDLMSEGKVRWFRRLEELADDETALSNSTGLPLAVNGRVIVQVFTGRPACRTRLVCLDPAGDVAWRCDPIEIDSSQGIPLAGGLCAGESTVYWSPDGNQILSLDAATGDRRWQLDLPEPYPDRFSRFPMPRIFLSESGELLVSRTGTLWKIDAAHGTLRWAHHFHHPAGEIIGEVDGIAILAGGRLSGIDLKTGHIIWCAGRAEHLDDDSGSAIIFNSTIIWSHSGEIWCVDARSGQVVQRSPFPGRFADAKCHFTLAGDTLLVQSARQLTAIRVLTGK